MICEANVTSILVRCIIPPITYCKESHCILLTKDRIGLLPTMDPLASPYEL